MGEKIREKKGGREEEKKKEPWAKLIFLSLTHPKMSAVSSSKFIVNFRKPDETTEVRARRTFNRVLAY